ncbi:PLP-dependent aminotransferase family protein [Sodalis sp. dw_96]|uniref:MocR-like pyridoxine biosynthesis transcription factor PdxR n=1 Tax=Sodalis sp. dw_96 TaxID=2719794 RepID=UPI001BD36B07|nr:PLP-dependent aminotransferase family protein [Sodalis sp. dw_96]
MPYQNIQLDGDRSIPLYLQIYRRFREAIANGRLHPGDRIPSVRSLASELDLARGTVETAYQLLISEGYLLTRGPAGTVVSPHLPTRRSQDRPTVSAIPPDPAFRPPRPVPLPLQLGLPALDAFPRKLWARLAVSRLRRPGVENLVYPDPRGYAPLRSAIAGYLGISRGIVCGPEQIFICAGYPAVLELICRCLMIPGDTCWFEDPGYPFARDVLAGAGAKLIPVPVDGSGLCVDAAQNLAEDARFAVVTPSHQSPLGVALSLPRRLALLEWANRRQSWIVEDDYDSEYRYHGRPLPALKSLDDGGRVLYAGTFSKVVYPGLRLAYLVVPAGLIPRFTEVCERMANHCPVLLQGTVSDFIEQGHFTRHLKKMRHLYTLRRRYLEEALQEICGQHLKIEPQAGGIQLLARLKAGTDDEALADDALASGVAVQALSRWCLTAKIEPGLLMGFTNIASPEQARDICRILLLSLNRQMMK